MNDWAVRAMDVRYPLLAHSQGKKQFSLIIVVQCISTSSRYHLQHRFFDATRTARVAQKIQIDQRGL